MKVNYWQKLEPNITYHIYNRGVDGINLFKDQDDYQLFLKLLERYLLPYLDILAYCLMPNHYHLLVKVKSTDTYLQGLESEETKAAHKLIAGEIEVDKFLSDQLRRMFSSYSLKYNNKHERKGPLFSPKVKRIAIVEPDRVRYLICYLHHNPIHHGFTKTYDEWKFSSYRILRSIVSTHLARNEVIELMNGMDAFIELHDLFKLSKSEELIDSDYLT